MNSTEEHAYAEEKLVITDDGFGLMILDILHGSCAIQIEDEIAPLAQQIMEAYRPRMEMAQRQAQEARQAVMAYAAMDRVQQEIMAHVKGAVSAMVEANAEANAYSNHLSMIRDEVRALVTDALNDGNDTIPTAALNGALGGNRGYNRRRQQPTQVGFAPDTRYTAGQFRINSREVTIPFLGWSMVVHSQATRSSIEATFLDAGHRPATLTALAGLGFQFLGLT